MRASLFLSGLFAISTALGVAAETSPVTSNADTSPVPTLHTNDKRTICFFGICFGEPDYSSDTDNCGRRGNCCSTSWSNGRGSQCRAGVCMPGSCNSGWTLNSDSASCVNLANDVNNWQVPPSSLQRSSRVAGCAGQPDREFVLPFVQRYPLEHLRAPRSFDSDMQGRRLSSDGMFVRLRAVLRDVQGPQQ